MHCAFPPRLPAIYRTTLAAAKAGPGRLDLVLERLRNNVEGAKCQCARKFNWRCSNPAILTVIALLVNRRPVDLCRARGGSGVLLAMNAATCRGLTRALIANQPDALRTWGL